MQRCKFLSETNGVASCDLPEGAKCPFSPECKLYGYDEGMDDTSAEEHEAFRDSEPDPGGNYELL